MQDTIREELLLAEPATAGPPPSEIIQAGTEPTIALPHMGGTLFAALSFRHRPPMERRG